MDGIRKYIGKTDSHMSYAHLKPLMERKKCKLTPEEFHERVNIIFHNHEAVLYDELHSDLKESLQEQVDLLIHDLKVHSSLPEKIAMLDIGCGTGLSTQYLLNSELGSAIKHITMLDSSPNMLKRAEEKALNWNKPVNFIKGYLQDLEEKFDLVIICSVLHHIPDLKAFFKHLKTFIKPNGILIHLQDPNADYVKDKVYKKRLFNIEQKMATKSSEKINIKKLVPKPLKRFLNRTRGRKDYIDLINDQLIEERVINKRMSAEELWMVTDIHVRSKTNRFSNGISLNFLKNQLTGFVLINARSYAFFGKMISELDQELTQKERYYISKNELNGRNISGIWIKKS
jgi:2-polyprenyl-3-methyl-5-hydroxy-6-metoxy-1,4-benzoquinol methylase